MENHRESQKRIDKDRKAVWLAAVWLAAVPTHSTSCCKVGSNIWRGH